MFFFISDRRLIRRITFTFFVMLCLSAALLFAGCSGAGAGAGTGSGAKGNLNGKWVNVYKSVGNPDYITTIKINTSAKTIVYEDSYEGKIVNTFDYTAADGVLIIQFTKYATNYDGNPVITHANVEKYGAMYWTELKPGSVKLADAYGDAPFYPHIMLDTIGEAKATFEPAADKVSSFVNWSITSPYTKK